MRKRVAPQQESATASDLPSIAKLTERLDDILAQVCPPPSLLLPSRLSPSRDVPAWFAWQVVAATQPLHLDPRKVELAITGVEAVNKAIVFLKELPRTVEPLVAKLEMVRGRQLPNVPLGMYHRHCRCSAQGYTHTAYHTCVGSTNTFAPNDTTAYFCF